MRRTTRYSPGTRRNGNRYTWCTGELHLFKAGTPERLGSIALEALRANAGGCGKDFAECLGIAPELAEAVYSRVAAKLEREPIEDYRLDFEDGYGYRPDAEEDVHAQAAARELAAGIGQPQFPPYCGFRIKPLTEALRRRSIRTFQLFMETLLDSTAGVLPPGFVVTLPKVTSSEQVAVFADLLELFESRARLAVGTLRMEVMIETAQAIVTPDGQLAIPELVMAARGRCRGAHFGAYDYGSDCNISAMYQGMGHPACDFARRIMQVTLAGRGIMLSDSLTSVMPIAIHRGRELSAQQVEENRQSVRRAWKLHFDDTRRSLRRRVLSRVGCASGAVSDALCSGVFVLSGGARGGLGTAVQFHGQGRTGDDRGKRIRRRGYRARAAELLPARDELRRDHGGGGGGDRVDVGGTADEVFSCDYGGTE